ncbi:MAG: hypothetical protein LBF89_05825 [Bacteroidales bacterium]|jgi:hypothetical protein|nr:hypothetical protein [Bacteroidales bacterium]
MKKIWLCRIALVCLTWTQAHAESNLKTKLPHIKGWEIDATVETFDSNTLFERINGAAPGYLLYNCKELTVFVYKQDKSDEYITVQVYRHATSTDAFGVYASERPMETDFVKTGAEGYREGAMFNFVANHFYVKIESPSEKASVIQAVALIAEGLANNIAPKATLPSELARFPAENKIAHSEQYIAQSFLGHEFLNNAFTADYQTNDGKYQLFVIDAGSTAGARAMLEKYFDFTKQSDAPIEGKIVIDDKYNGQLVCRWKNRHVWGILNDNGLSLPFDEILNEVEEKL